MSGHSKTLSGGRRGDVRRLIDTHCHDHKVYFLVARKVQPSWGTDLSLYSYASVSYFAVTLDFTFGPKHWVQAAQN
jgi:hypothetical protein